MSINFLAQAAGNVSYPGGPYTTYDANNGSNPASSKYASMTMKSVSGVITAAQGGLTQSAVVILNTRSTSNSYIVQNFMVHNPSEDTYNSVHLETMINYQNQNSTNNSGYIHDIINQRLIGPQQTAQLISKDTSFVFGAQREQIVYETTYGRICDVRLNHSGGTDIHY